jgi:Ca2+-binding RTX toxin-like protein
MRRRSLAIALSLVLVGTSIAAAATIPGTDRANVLRGGSGADTLLGKGGNDRLFGLGGRDRVIGGPGNDLLVGGPGRDTISGGDGRDRIDSRDGFRDVVRCGRANDRVKADQLDVIAADCENSSGGPAPSPSPSPSPSPQPAPPPNSGQTVVRVDEPWTCTGRVNLDLVKVTMRTNNSDAVYLRTNCTGRIGRIEVDTWTADGVKINAPTPVAHDLTIWGGYIRCHESGPGHQDGVQAMAGERITFRSVEINCSSSPNAQFFVAGANGGLPTDVVCERCFLGSGAASTLFVSSSVRSGARNTLVCAGRFHDIRIDGAARTPVNSANTLLPRSDRRC